MQLQGIGTSWMFPQKKDAAFDQLIGQMSLEDVRPFMCPKSHGNPKVCEGCNGFRTCPAGQRAVRLMNEAEMKKQETPSVKAVPVDSSKDRDLFRLACESGNAWNYLMKNFGMSEAAAQEKLNFWCSHYMAIVKEFGGRKRIMAKPKSVTITRIGGDDAGEPQNEQEQAPDVKVEETADQVKEVAEIASEPLRGRALGTEVNRERARKEAAEAFGTEDPILHLMKKDGVSAAVARNRVSNWKKRYPDLAGDYQLPNWRITPKPVLEAEEEPPKEEPPKEELNDDFEDTVSLEDFLAEYEQPAPTEEYLPEEPQNDNPMLEALNSKYRELEEEKRRLEEKIREIEEQQEALVKTLALFRK